MDGRHYVILTYQLLRASVSLGLSVVAEALFIPEGWWHQITSTRGTVGVNVWFKVSASA